MIKCKNINSSTVQRHTELRKLPAASLCNIASILEINNDWQKVISFIPKDLQGGDNNFERKYNSEHIRLIEQRAKTTNQKCAEVLFEEWGTSGRIRPTLDNLMKILEKAKIFRAADEIARMLGEPPPRRPSHGPEAFIPLNLTDLLDDGSVEQRLHSLATIQSDNFNNSNHDNAVCNPITLTTEELPDFGALIPKSETNRSITSTTGPTGIVSPQVDTELPSDNLLYPSELINNALLEDKNDRSVEQRLNSLASIQSDNFNNSNHEHAVALTTEELPDFGAMIPKSETNRSVTCSTSPTGIESSQVETELSSGNLWYPSKLINNALLEDKETDSL